MSYAGLHGALFNVKINIGSIKDESFVREIREKIKLLTDQGESVYRQVIQKVNDQLD